MMYLSTSFNLFLRNRLRYPNINANDSKQKSYKLIAYLLILEIIDSKIDEKTQVATELKQGNNIGYLPAQIQIT